jgi:hypothetical protein
LQSSETVSSLEVYHVDSLSVAQNSSGNRATEVGVKPDVPAICLQNRKTWKSVPGAAANYARSLNGRKD